MDKNVRAMLLATGMMALVLAVSACVPVTVPTPAPSVTSQADTIQGVVWQWTSVTNQTTRATETVPSPEQYTIVFNADDTLYGQADCNNFSGTYSQENGFSITLGATTMAFCGEASLDQQYLALLSEVAAGGPDGTGGLALETAGGEQRMSFQNGGEATGP